MAKIELPGLLKSASGVESYFIPTEVTLIEALNELCIKHPMLSEFVFNNNGDINLMMKFYVDSKEYNPENHNLYLGRECVIRVVTPFAGG